MELAAIRVAVLLNAQSPTSRLQVSDDRKCIQERVGSGDDRIRKHVVEYCGDTDAQAREVYDGCQLDGEVDRVVDGFNTGLFSVAVRKEPAVTSELFALCLDRLAVAVKEASDDTQISYAFIGVSDSRCVNLVAERGISPISHVSDIEPMFQQVSSIDVVKEKVGRGSTLPFVCFVRVDVLGSTPTRGQLCLVDLKTMSFDDDNMNARMSVSAASLARSALVLKSVVQSLSQVSFTGQIPYDEASLTALAADLIGGNSHTTFLVDILNDQDTPTVDVASALSLVHTLRKVKNRTAQCLLDKQLVAMQRNHDRLKSDRQNEQYMHQQTQQKLSTVAQRAAEELETREAENAALHQEVADVKARFGKLADMLAEKNDRFISLEQRLVAVRDEYEEQHARTRDELRFTLLTHQWDMRKLKDDTLLARDWQRQTQRKLAMTLDERQRDVLHSADNAAKLRHLANHWQSAQKEIVRLTMERSRIASACQKAEELLANSVAENSKLAEDLAATQGTTADQRQEFDRALTKLKAAAARCAELQTELRMAQQKYAPLEDTVDRLRKELQQLRASAEETQRALADAQSAEQLLQGELEDAAKRNEILQKEHELASDKVARLEDSLRDGQTRLARLKTDHEKALRTHEAAVQSLRTEKQELEKQMLSEVASLVASQRQASDKLNAAQEEMIAMKRQHIKALTQLNQQLEVEQLKNNSLAEEITEYKAQLQEQASSTNPSTAAQDLIRSERQKSDAKYRKLQTQFNTACEQLADARNQLIEQTERHEAQTDRLQHQIEQLQSKLDSSNKQAKSASQSQNDGMVKDLQREKKQLEAQVKSLTAQLGKITMELEAERHTTVAQASSAPPTQPQTMRPESLPSPKSQPQPVDDGNSDAEEEAQATQKQQKEKGIRNRPPRKRAAKAAPKQSPQKEQPLETTEPAEVEEVPKPATKPTTKTATAATRTKKVPAARKRPAAAAIADDGDVSEGEKLFGGGDIPPKKTRKKDTAPAQPQPPVRVPATPATVAAAAAAALADALVDDDDSTETGSAATTDSGRSFKFPLKKRRRKLDKPPSLLSVIDTPAAHGAANEKVQQTIAFLQSAFPVVDLKSKLAEAKKA
ncbi:hypothetical protein RI367_004357 [Sorochytrium milnesiophthora]